MAATWSFLAPQAKEKYVWNLGYSLGSSWYFFDGNSEKPIATTMGWLQKSKKEIRPFKNEGLSFTQMKQVRLTEMPAIPYC